MKTLKKVLLTSVLTTVSVCTISISCKAATVKVTGDTLNIRKGPSTSEEVIAMVSKDVECEVIEEKGDWYKIKYKNYTGYISKEYAKIVQESSNSQEQNSNEQNSQISGNNQNNTNNQSNSNNQTTSNNSQTNSNSNNSAQNNQASQNETSNPNSSVNKPEENTPKEDEKPVVTYKKLKSNESIKILPLVYASKLGEVKKGTEVILLSKTKGWSYIQTNTISGWVRNDILEDSKQKENSASSSSSNNNEEKIAYINESSVNLRKSATTNSDVVKVLTLNAELTILAEEGSWYKVKVGKDTGYVSKEFVSNQKKVTSRSREREEGAEKNEQNTNDSTSKNQEANATKPNSSVSEKEEEVTIKSQNSVKGTDVVAYAKKYLGHKYVYGGDGSNGTFDCSGFTMYVYKHFDVKLPHGATSQYKSGKGTKVSKQSELQVGDIVFLTDYSTGKGIGHCGIYIGNNNFIHASTTSYTVTISNLNTTYKNRFYAGLRLI